MSRLSLAPLHHISALRLDGNVSDRAQLAKDGNICLFNLC